MYSVLMSKFSEGFCYIEEQLKKIIPKDANIVIIPWSFPTELKSKKIDEFFDNKKKENYIKPLYKIGINPNIIILDCYNDTKKYMIDKINKADVIILTGGNPEMLYNKVIETGILECLKKFKKVIIGSSAGAEIQLKKYFITKKNNYYNKFGWYEGLGIIDNNFYFDVHSTNRGRYLLSLKERSLKMKKRIYCLFDTGTIIYKRDTKNIKCFGKYIEFDGQQL